MLQLLADEMSRAFAQLGCCSVRDIAHVKVLMLRDVSQALLVRADEVIE
jgi:isopentenyl diphosphate isomerase/L-lactate dehydrogenase-like FMN-dependent dehydrogenase